MRTSLQTLLLAVVQVSLLSLPTTVQAKKNWGILQWIFGDDYGNSAYYLLGRPDGKHDYPSNDYLKEHGYIVKATTTVLVPLPPISKKDPFAIFPGLQNDWSDLVQSVIAYFPATNSTHGAPCGTQEGYCAFANFYTQGNGEPKQWSAKGKLVNTNDLVTIEYVYNKDNGEYAQTVTTNGEVISQLSKKPEAGAIHQWSPKTECIGAEETNSPPHVYRDTTIELAEAVPQYADTVMAVNTDATPPTTLDGGKTWKIAQIAVAGVQCKGAPSKGDTLAYIVEASSNGEQVVSEKRKRSAVPQLPKQKVKRAQPWPTNPKF